MLFIQKLYQRKILSAHSLDIFISFLFMWPQANQTFVVPFIFGWAVTRAENTKPIQDSPVYISEWVRPCPFMYSFVYASIKIIKYKNKNSENFDFPVEKLEHLEKTNVFFFFFLSVWNGTKWLIGDNHKNEKKTVLVGAFTMHSIKHKII